MLSRERASELALDYLNRQRPEPEFHLEWAPSMRSKGFGRELPERVEIVVVDTEDALDAWRVFYDSRMHAETGDIRHSLLGNLPLLVDKSSGELTYDPWWDRMPVDPDATEALLRDPAERPGTD
jgi:hypothetical protein